MKKNIFFIALVTLLAVSCKNNSQNRDVVNTQQAVTLTTDTVINVTEKAVKTAPRFSCDGKKLKQPKLVSVDSETTPVTISQSKTEIVEIDCQACLEANGVTSRNSSGTSNNSNSNPDLSWLWWVLAVVLVALAIWFISWLIKNWPKRNNNSSLENKSNMNNNSAANPDRIAALTAMIATMKGGDCSGKGMVKDTNSGFEMVVGNPPSRIKIINSGSGNVYVGDNMHLVNSGNATAIPAEPKKDEPAATDTPA